MSAVLEGKQKKSCPNQLYIHVFEYGILLSKYDRKLKHLAALDPLDTTSFHLQLNMIREPFFDFGDIRKCLKNVHQSRCYTTTVKKIR